MIEQTLFGDAPTTAAGKEIRFPSNDVWVALHASITSDLYPDLPFFPSIDARDAEILAAAIRGAIDDGSCKRHFEDQARLNDLSTPKEAEFAAETNLGWMKRFAAFLEGSGGCRPG